MAAIALPRPPSRSSPTDPIAPKRRSYTVCARSAGARLRSSAKPPNSTAE